MIASVYSTLSGRLVGKHPTLGALVSEDGWVYIPKTIHSKGHWTEGSPAGKYRVVQINRKTLYVHKLMLETFRENPEHKPTGDHIDRTGRNVLSNLRWATQAEQNENRSTVINRADYGVRSKDDPKAYGRAQAKAYYHRMKSDPDFVNKIRERNRIAMRKRRAKKKAERLAQPS